MIRSSVDLPEPFGPSTPILAPGEERERDVAQHLPSGPWNLLQRYME